MIHISYKLISGISCKFGMSDNRQLMFRPLVLPTKISPPQTSYQIKRGVEKA